MELGCRCLAALLCSIDALEYAPVVVDKAASYHDNDAGKGDKDNACCDHLRASWVVSVSIRSIIKTIIFQYSAA